ncbi:MAG: universal stress protein [Flavobacteriales bacterium]
MKKILVPIDFSAFSFHALGVAADIARKASAEIHLLHLVEDAEKVNNKEINKQFLDVIELKSMAGLKIINALKIESIDEGIEQYATKNKIDLIVMGSHGHRTFHDEIFGSNTDKVMKNSSLPLLIVKESTTDFSINTLVFSSNFYKEASASFKKVKPLLDLYRPEIHLLSVLPENTEEKEEFAKRLMFDFAAEHKLEGYCCRTVTASNIEEGINKYCNQVNPELLMMETHGKSQLSHLLFGSVSEDLAAKRKQPVLTLRIPNVELRDDVIFPA